MSSHCEEMEDVSYTTFRVKYCLTQDDVRFNIPRKYVITFYDVDGNESTIHLTPKLAFNIANAILASYVPEE